MQIELWCVGQCLQFDTIEGVSVHKELLEWGEVAHTDLVLQKLDSFLEVAIGGV